MKSFRVSDTLLALFFQIHACGIRRVDRLSADPHPFVATSEKECGDSIVVL